MTQLRNLENNGAQGKAIMLREHYRLTPYPSIQES